MLVAEAHGEQDPHAGKSPCLLKRNKRGRENTMQLVHFEISCSGVQVVHQS